MSEIPPAQSAAPEPAVPVADTRSLLEIGALLTLGALAFAAVVGVIAVLDAGSRAAGFGVGLGIAVLIFIAGATIACALACLARGRMELVAIVGLAAACISIDLLILAVWLEIENEAYAKVTGVGFVWSFFALVILGLALAVAAARDLAFVLYACAVAATGAAALVSTWLVVTAGTEDVPVTTSPAGLLPGDDGLLQALGAIFVLLAAFWFGALAAGRLERQMLNRTLTTSPSSTT